MSWTEEPVGLQSMASQRVKYDWATQQQQTRFVMAFLPRSECLLISRLQSPSPVISKPKQIKSVTVSTFFPSTCHEVMEPDAMILVFWMLSVKATFSVSMFACIQITILLKRPGIFCTKPGKNMLVKLFQSINKCTSHSCTEFWVTANYHLILHTHTDTHSCQMKWSVAHFIWKRVYMAVECSACIVPLSTSTPEMMK